MKRLPQDVNENIWFWLFFPPEQTGDWLRAPKGLLTENVQFIKAEICQSHDQLYKLFEHSLDFFLWCWIFLEFHFKSFFERKKKRKSLLFLESDMRWPEKKKAGRLFFFSLFFAVIVRNKVPVSFVTGTQSRIETGKAIIGEIVPQGIEKLSAWRLGLGGTPMAPCIILAWGRFGNRLPISTNTWLSHPPAPPPPLRPPLPCFSRPSYLVPCFCSSSLPQNPAPLLSRCLTMLTACQEEGEGENTRIHIHTQGCGCVQRARRRHSKFRVCNHVALFPIRKQLIVDTSRGGNCWLRT